MRCPILPLTLLFAPVAHAQSASPLSAQARDVVRESDDAFGRRIGVEDLGLYSESEVRGFDLQSAGNYRIEDHYFVRAAGLLQPVTESTAIRVGVSALRTDFAAPSGVVQYTLPDGTPGVHPTIEAGWWGGSGPVVLPRLAAMTRGGDLSVAGGIQLSLAQRYTDGTRGDFVAFGAVPRWRPSRGIRLTGIWSRNHFTRDASTFYAVTGAPPARIRRGIDRTQQWMDVSNTSDLLGVMADIEAVAGWTFGASAFRSSLPYQRSVFNLIRLPEDGGPAEASGLLYGAETRSSISAEITAARHFVTGSLQHRLLAMVRRRDSVALSDPGAAFQLGQYSDMNAPPERERPTVPLDSRRLRDDVGQWTAGFGYRLSIGDAAEIRADVQRVDYVKQARALDGSVTHNASRPWLYGGAFSVAITRALTGYVSFTRGLEESGVAPANAVNRGAILPAAISRQSELGLKYPIRGGPTLIAGLFDLSKPLLGIDARGAFSFVGTVRHRGAELSLAGPVTPRLNVVIGATYLDAHVHGELVDLGLYGIRPVNRPSTVVLANATWRVPWVERLTIDGGMTFRSQRYADRANSVRLPSYAILNLGLRQAITLDGKTFTLRARVTNLTDRFAWNVGNSGLLNPISPRAMTLTLSGGL
jgi:iron complex outermembrane receptor protein